MRGGSARNGLSRKARSLLATTMSLFILAGATGIVFADSLTNDLTVGSPDLVLEDIGLELAGGSQSVEVWLVSANVSGTDSDVNCNLDGGADHADFTATSSDTSKVTVSPSSFQLTGCTSGAAQTLTISPIAQGSADITFGFTSSTEPTTEQFNASAANFKVWVDESPTVNSTSPADGDGDVAADASITVDFSEPVDITNTSGWYSINCTLSGSHTAVTSNSGTASVTLNPGTDFTAGESCTVDVNHNHVADTDAIDNPSNNGPNLNNPVAGYSFDFSVGAANGAPDVDAGGPYSGNEGSPISISGTADDPDDDSLTYLWSINTTGIDASGSCSIAAPTSLSTTVTCDDDSNGSAFTLTLTVNGDPDGSVSDTANVTVTNVAPTVSLASGNSVSVTESTAAVEYGYTADDAGDNDTLTNTISCGANGSLVANSDDGDSFQCQFLDGGPASPGTTSDVTITVTDDESTASTQAKQTVAVANANPVVAQPSFSATTICQGSQATLAGISFSDAGTIDNPWGISIDWGDGSTDYSTSVSTQGAQSNVSPTYNSPGTYTATVTVTDKDGGTGSNTSSNQVTVVAHYTMTFLQPVDGTTDGSVTNSVKLGRVVPIKVVIRDNCANGFTGGYVTDPATLVRLRAALAPASGGAILDTVEQYADAGQANNDTLYFRWTADVSAPGGGFWIYNLDTKNSSQPKFELTKTYRIDASIGGIIGGGTGSQYALLKMAK
jgi:hypothetical protein